MPFFRDFIGAVVKRIEPLGRKCAVQTTCPWEEALPLAAPAEAFSLSLSLLFSGLVFISSGRSMLFIILNMRQPTTTTESSHYGRKLLAAATC